MAVKWPFISKYASVDNLGVTIAAIGDYSSTVTDFSVGPPAGEVWDMLRVIPYIEDAGAFAPNKYGFLTALTIGVQIGIYRAGVLQLDLLDGVPIKQNNHWKRQCFDIEHGDFGTGQATETLGARWTFAKSGVPISLDGDESDQIRVRLSDSFSGLVDHTFLFQGNIRQPDAGRGQPPFPI